MKQSAKTVTISRFSPHDKKGVIDVILPIQNQEFNITISVEQQPDLNAIPEFYQQGEGDFWVAKYQGKIIGTLGLKDLGHHQAALRKMFVSAPFRGHEYGVAAGLLQVLMTHAIANGVKAIFLGTTANFLAAHRFYEKHGFQEITPCQLPAAFPLMSVDTKFYRYTFR